MHGLEAFASMRLVLVLTLALVAASIMPVASARPECLQVYPWSELCQGDVDGFLCAMRLCVELACDSLRDCVAIFEPVCPGGPPCPPDPSWA